MRPISLLLALCTAASAVSAQSIRVAIPDTGAMARQAVMVALSDASFPIVTIAACDCAITTGTIKVKTGFTEMPQFLTLDVQILRDSIGSTVVIRPTTNMPTLGWTKPGMPPTPIQFTPDSTRRATRSVSRPVFQVVAQLAQRAR